MWNSHFHKYQSRSDTHRIHCLKVILITFLHRRIFKNRYTHRAFREVQDACCSPGCLDRHCVFWFVVSLNSDYKSLNAQQRSALISTRMSSVFFYLKRCRIKMLLLLNKTKRLWIKIRYYFIDIEIWVLQQYKVVVFFNCRVLNQCFVYTSLQAKANVC